MRIFLGQLVLSYLRFWAKLQLKKNAPDCIGITGSAGKTSTRNAVAAVLQDKYQLKVSQKANSESGIPLNILDLDIKHYRWVDWVRVLLLAPWRVLTHWPRYQKYIVEMGIDSPFPPKNMSYLLSIVQPRTGIILNALPVHTQAFDPLIHESDPDKRRQALVECIAQEKGKLIVSLPKSGLAIINGSQPELLKLSQQTSASTMLYGWDQPEALIKTKHLDVLIQEVFQTLNGTRFVYNVRGTTIELSFPRLLLPNHYAETFAAAMCVGLDEDYTPDEVAHLIETNYVIPPGRSSIIPGIKGSVILDSSYNASTQPMLDSLNLLKQLNPGRSLALLGDMRELGEETASEHRLVAQRAAEVCHRVLLVGPQMKRYVLPELKQAKHLQVSWHRNALEAAAVLEKELRVGDVLLVKGSQNTLFLEAAVEKLMRHQDKANDLLCRRGSFWDQQRRAAGLAS